MNNKKLDYSNEEVMIDVSVTSFMMTVATFFTGFLISSYSSYDNSVRIPIFFLIVSTLSFLFTNIIFANAAGEIRAGNRAGANKHAITGNIISEFLGIYLLVIALPLAINAITKDSFLQVAVFTISMVALLGYSVSSFSIIKRYINAAYPRLLFSVVFVALWAICFLTQEGDSVAYICSSVALIAYLTVTTMLLLLKKKD